MFGFALGSGFRCPKLSHPAGLPSSFVFKEVFEACTYQGLGTGRLGFQKENDQRRAEESPVPVLKFKKKSVLSLLSGLTFPSEWPGLGGRS